MPSSRRPAVLLLAVALAGCTITTQGTASPADPSADAPTESTGPLSAVDGPELLSEALGGAIVGTTLDPAGELVLVVARDLGMPVELLRRTGDTWRTTVLGDQLAGPGTLSTVVSTTADGNAVVVSPTDGGYAITMVPPDGEASTVPIEDVDVEHDNAVEFVAVAPTGDVVYVGFEDFLTNNVRVLSVDPATGEARGDHRVVPESGDLQGAVSAATPDGHLLVVVTHDLDDNGTGDVTTLLRFDADLQVLADVAIVDDGLPTDGRHVSVGADGTAYVVVHTGISEEEEFTGVRLLGVEEGATTATELVSLPHDAGITQVALDAAGRWLYLVGSDDIEEPAALTVVDIGTGDAAEPLPLCAGLLVTELLLRDDGAGAFITIFCDGDDGSSLFTLS